MELRNVAIVAHVDHGKTTLVDAMLRASGAFGERAALVDRVMDSGDLEREKGITILAKHTAIDWRGMTVNVVDTPGHADFGGEVERGLSMVDGVLLLVDACEGPLPQTRFVLRKTLWRACPSCWWSTRPTAPTPAAPRSSTRASSSCWSWPTSCSSTRTAPPSCSTCRSSTPPAARAAPPATAPPTATLPDDARTSSRCSTSSLATVPPPADDPDAPAAGARHQPRRQQLPRPHRAVPGAGGLDPPRPAGRVVPGRRHRRPRQDHRAAAHRGAGRACRPTSASAGDLVAVAGIAEVTIGDTLADPENPVALPRIAVDEPAISMTIGINTSPLVGRDPHPGTKLTARQVRNRLDTELVGNVSVRVLPTERPDTWEVQGRGELALAVLVETMRREGFEMTVGKPEVVTKVIDGKLHEPFEHLSVDVPTESLGAVTQLVARRKGELIQMVHGESRVRMEYRVPSRGLIGFRTEFLTITRGAGIASHVFDGYGPWVGEINSRLRGSLIADRAGPVTGYAVDALADRGELFVGPGTLVYEGMVIGEYTRNEDLEVNIVREKKLTNMRKSTGDELIKLTPPTASDPGAEPGVLRLGRVRRGHAGERPHPQGRARLALPGPCAGPRPRRELVAVVVFAAGPVEREAPVGVGAEVAQPAHRDRLVLGQVGAHIAVPAAPGDGDLLQLRPALRGVEVQMAFDVGLQTRRGNRHAAIVTNRCRTTPHSACHHRE